MSRTFSLSIMMENRCWKADDTGFLRFLASPARDYQMDFFNLFKFNKKYEIKGTHCLLKPLKRRDLRALRAWFKDFDLIRHAFGVIAGNDVLKKIANDYLKEIFSGQDEILGISTIDGDLVGFLNFDIGKTRGKVTRIGILIGEEKNRSQGLGTEALNLALFYLFDRMDVDRVELDTAYFNVRAQKCFKKCGFKKTSETKDANVYGCESVKKDVLVLSRKHFFNDIYKKFENLPQFEGDLPQSKYVQIFMGEKYAPDNK